MFEKTKNKIKEKVNYEENENKIKKAGKLALGGLVGAALLTVGFALGKGTRDEDDDLDEDELELEDNELDDLYLCEEDTTDEEDDLEESEEESVDEEL